MTDMKRISALFDGWEETMIWSCLQGHMGTVMADCEETPRAAQIVLGDFCFFAGLPDVGLVERAGAAILVPQNEAWCGMIEHVWKEKVMKASRYAIKKEKDIFDRERLRTIIGRLPAEYRLQPIDRPVYEYCMAHDWSADLCGQFKDYEDYRDRGVGTVVLKDGLPVAGASSYSVYTGGIEIEIDTRQEYRRQGLAAACGSGLILTCLDRQLYPSWDAYDLRSAALAEKLGYHRGKEYQVYIKQ